MLVTYSVPPYQIYDRVEGTLVPRAGQVVVAVLAPDEFNDHSVLSRLTDLREQAPWAHLLLHADDRALTIPSGIGEIAAHGVGACGWTTCKAPGRSELVRTLCRDLDVKSEVLRLLLEYHPTVPYHVWRMLEAVVTAGSTADLSEPDCRRFARNGLPRPAPIARLVRTLPVVIALQADHRLPVLSAGLEGGFSDASSFTRACHRLFGSDTSQLRSAVGVRWPFWCWWTRHRPGGKEQ